VTEANYVSGDDYVVEFLGYRFGFNSSDFEQRVTAAAVKLGLVGDNELDDDETADLVELVERDWIDEPRSGLGRYLVRHWERVSLVSGESLVYWLKKLVFRGAWLDHRVKEGLLEVAWDEDVADFGYRFSFNASDFEQRVTAAAVKLGLLAGNELDDDETADLVELVERDAIDEPRSSLGRYLVRHWAAISLVEGESLVYWLKKRAFRGASLE